MIQTRFITFAGMVIAGSGFLLAAVSAPKYYRSATASDYRATLDRYCFRCHSSTMPRAGVNLRVLDFANLEDHGDVWEKMLRKLRNHEMPPPGRWRPDAETNEALVNYIETERDRLTEVKPNPGRPTLHRLNRAEYANAIRDLLALEIDGADLLPADDVGYGFDNIGDVLSVSPFLLERYLAVAGKISRQAVGDTAMPAYYQTYVVPPGLKQGDRMGEALPVASRGGTAIRHRFPVDGEYEISVTLQRDKADNVLGMNRERKLDLRLDDRVLALFTIAANPKSAGLGSGPAPDANLKVRLPVKAGTREITAAFMKDAGLVEGIIPRIREDQVRTYYEGVGSITVAGPYSVEGPGTTPSRDRIFICRPEKPIEEEACAEKILANLARHAYRRPVMADDISRLLALYRQGAEDDGFESGIELALQKILVSPDFLFRAEYDPPDAVPGSVHRISDVELASRLSFFLWSSIPDEELIAVAENGKLSDPSVLQQQVRRMLADPRSHALVANFVGQWLFLRSVQRIQPDTSTFTYFDENLRAALEKETELLVESTLREDRDVADLLDTDYTFVNQRLAQHYGIPGIYGSEFRRVAITDPNRRGLLGQASILAVTSYSNRTAPTIRGKWVLEQLLGAHPPPPPPNVPSLKDDVTTKNLTMRQRMEAHRSNPTCAACHRMMDPIGFALDNFDGVGAWHNTTKSGELIDSSGALPDGTTFDGPAGLRKVLLSKKDQFVETFTERLLTYALGRGTEEYDRPVIRKIARVSATDNHRWSSVILGIVSSAPFQMRRVGNGHS